MSHRKKQPAGITLIELAIAISIFSIIIVVALNSFLSVLKFSREAIQKQAIQDHSEFLFSLMGREIRMARINYGDYEGNKSCDNYFQMLSGFQVLTDSVKHNDTYWLSEDHQEIRFQNYEGLCVRYFFVTDFDGYRGLKVARYNPQTTPVGDFAVGDSRVDWVLPRDIEVTNLYFEVQNMFDKHNVDGTAPAQPPAVKYSMTLRSAIWEPSDIRIFNVITGRNFEQF